MHHTHDNNQIDRHLRGQPSVLARLRDLLSPGYCPDFPETLRLAERQAEAFLRLTGLADSDRPVPARLITGLPRIKVVCEPIAESGMSQYVGGTWLIVLNSRDHRLRQRFTLAHEFKHVLDHHDAKVLYTGRHWLPDDERAAEAVRQRERAADHFAGCLLMPDRQVTRLWTDGLHSPDALADHFDVSTAAMRVRLEQLGLARPSWMCTRGLPNLDKQTLNLATRQTVAKIQALGLRDPRWAARLYSDPTLAGRPT